MEPDRDTIERRRENARQELVARGVLKSGDYPPALRLMLKVFPRQKPPYYGDHLLYGFQMGLLFAIPMGGLITFAFVMDEDLPAWPGLALGVLSGVGFGGLMSYFMATVHRRLKLTPWDRLDEAPGAAPEGAEDFEDVETDWVRSMSRLSSRARR